MNLSKVLESKFKPSTDPDLNHTDSNELTDFRTYFPCWPTSNDNTDKRAITYFTELPHDFVLGQLYVGSGYRIFARSLNRIFDTIEVQVGQDYGPRFY